MSWSLGVEYKHMKTTFHTQHSGRDGRVPLFGAKEQGPYFSVLF